MRKALFNLFFILHLFVPPLSFSADKNEVVLIPVKPVSFNSDGVIALWVEFNFPKKEKIYYWERGYVEPFLNDGVFVVKVYSENGEELRVEDSFFGMPKIPAKPEIKEVTHFRYDRPMFLKISNEDEIVYKGCIKVSLKYDYTPLEGYESPLFKWTPDSLSKLKLQSESVKLCNDTADADFDIKYNWTFDRDNNPWK